MMVLCRFPVILVITLLSIQLSGAFNFYHHDPRLDMDDFEEDDSPNQSFVSRFRNLAEKNKFEIYMKLGNGATVGCEVEKKQDYDDVTEFFLEDEFGRRAPAIGVEPPVARLRSSNSLLHRNPEATADLLETEVPYGMWPAECLHRLMGFSFGLENNLCNCPTGPPGITGRAGIDGPQGPDGPAGNPGNQGADGREGPQGPQGPPGEVGEPGEQGPEGDTGPQGPQGSAGNQGTPGRNGRVGLPGVPGRPGQNGQPGKNGNNGRDGRNGPQGPQGDTGFPGLQGENGMPGRQGQNGNPGANGLNGVDGNNGEPGIPGQNGVITTGLYLNSEGGWSAAPPAGGWTPPGEDSPESPPEESGGWSEYDPSVGWSKPPSPSEGWTSSPSGVWQSSPDLVQAEWQSQTSDSVTQSSENEWSETLHSPASTPATSSSTPWTNSAPFTQNALQGPPQKPQGLNKPPLSGVQDMAATGKPTFGNPSGGSSRPLGLNSPSRPLSPATSSLSGLSDSIWNSPQIQSLGALQSFGQLGNNGGPMFWKNKGIRANPPRQQAPCSKNKGKQKKGSPEAPVKVTEPAKNPRPEPVQVEEPVPAQDNVKNAPAENVKNISPRARVDLELEEYY